MLSKKSAAGIVKTYYDSYPARDREAIEAVVAEDFHFTSPLDNHIDRWTYFDRCWPNGEAMAAIDIERLTLDGDHAFVTYAFLLKDGRRSRNTEVLTVKHGQITEVEVYFGWTIPHKAPPGGSLPETADQAGTV